MIESKNEISSGAGADALRQIKQFVGSK